MISSAKEGLERFKATQEKVQALIDWYRKLQEISIPDLIIEIGDDVDMATEFLVPKLPSEKLSTWRKRAAKIEKVNNCLTDFEFGIIDELTVSNTRIFAAEFYKVFGVFEWLAGHIGEITLAIAAGAGAASGFYGDDVERGAKKLWEDLWKVDVKETLKDAVRLVKPTQKLIAEAIEVGILGIIVTTIEGALVGFSAEKYAEKIFPVLKVKAATENELMEAAFPQGTGRVRRRKAHRVRTR